LQRNKISPEEDLLEAEKKKIKSAVITDFILSVEIIIIALGTVVHETLGFQIIVVTIVALIATVGVYGLVALIVRLDDIGFNLQQAGKAKQPFLFYLGTFLIKALPWIIKSLSVIGTLALLLVAGGIFIHYLDFLHDFLLDLPGILRDFVIGLIGGIPCLLIVKSLKAVWRKNSN
jgi:predicted DNA repair protein MutK